MKYAHLLVAIDCMYLFQAPAQILVHALQGVAPVIQAQAPTREAFRQIVNRKRKASLDAPMNPTDRASLVIPDKYAFYLSGDVRERFLLIDSGVDDESRYKRIVKRLNKMKVV